MTRKRNSKGPYLPAGTRVRYDGAPEDDPEYGVVIHCWMDKEINCHDCFVAFFGDAPPTGQPEFKPYVLRFFTQLLTVLDEEDST